MNCTKKVVFLLGAFALGISALAAPSNTDSETDPAAPSTVAQKVVPSGFGPLKLGMTKEAIDALPAEGDAFLTIPLGEKDPKPEPGRTRYGSWLKSPLTKEPAEVSLTFEQGTLSTLTILLEEDTLKGAEAQLSAKYGPPAVSETADEEQCLYKNGSNFKLPRRQRQAIWEGQAPDGQRAKVSLLALNHGMCPSNLMYGTTTSLKNYSLSFSRVTPAPPEPAKKNLF